MDRMYKSERNDLRVLQAMIEVSRSPWLLWVGTEWSGCGAGAPSGCSDGTRKRCWDTRWKHRANSLFRARVATDIGP
jgi:hypothetical protein